MTLDSKIPGGPLADKWDRHKFEVKPRHLTAAWAAS